MYTAVLLGLLLLACSSNEKAAAPPPPSAAQPETIAPSIHFVEVAATVGLSWRHENGLSDKRHFPETMGGGGAFLDYDSDGDLDVYAINGAFIDASPQAPRPINARR